MKRILIVDDEIQLVEMVKMRLEAVGYEVIPFLRIHKVSGLKSEVA